VLVTEHGELGEVDLLPGAGGLLMGGCHHVEVVDPVGTGLARAAWGTARWVWRRVTNGVATPALVPFR